MTNIAPGAQAGLSRSATAYRIAIMTSRRKAQTGSACFHDSTPRSGRSLIAIAAPRPRSSAFVSGTQ